MPTLSGDTQAVMVTDKVRFQGQEVAAVVAEDPYINTPYSLGTYRRKLCQEDFWAMYNARKAKVAHYRDGG